MENNNDPYEGLSPEDLSELDTYCEAYAEAVLAYRLAHENEATLGEALAQDTLPF